MADTQDSSEPQGSPFSRPAFVVAGVLVLAIVLLGIIVAVRVAGSNNATAQPPPVSTSSPAATPTAAPSTPTADPSSSVCGLAGSADDGGLDAAPAAEWEFQGTTAYPTSREFGPAKEAAEGYRYCFQHTPTGALFMAANALTQGSDPEVGDRWVEYALGQGQYRKQLLSRLGTARGSEGTRVRIAGFRILSYDGASARIDLGTTVSSQNQNLTASCAYDLVWQDGDWKISADTERPVDFATVPNLSRYIPWEE